jgi:hypothetical protein
LRPIRLVVSNSFFQTQKNNTRLDNYKKRLFLV